MFQAEPILWLQSWASAGLTSIMSGITLLGYTPVYVAVVLVLAFAVRLRAALAVLLALLLAGVLVDTMKAGFALPRPSDVDARITEPGDTRPVVVAQRGAAPGFWGLPTPEARAALRAKAGADYGFPSGHVGSAAAFLFGLALFHRSRRLAIVAIAWSVLMALSRMYLGRHFLADVLGGFAVGIVAAVAAAVLTERGGEGRRAFVRLVPLLAIAAVLLVLAPFLTVLPDENTGRLVGFAGACAILAFIGFPEDEATFAQRCGRVIVAAALYVLLSRVCAMLLEVLGWEDLRLAALFVAALVTAGTFAGGIAVCRRIGWYRSVSVAAGPQITAAR